MKIVWIAIDTLRADRLGCCGANRKHISPHIDQLAQNGILFENLIAENNVTQSDFVTMMTGKHPYQHGIVNMKPMEIPNKLIQRHPAKTRLSDGGGRLQSPDHRKKHPLVQTGF